MGSTKSKNKYNKKAYDRLTLMVPKGGKQQLQDAAESDNCSVNTWIKEAILKRWGLDTWPAVKQPEAEN